MTQRYGKPASTDLDAPTHADLKEKCNQLGISISEGLRRAVDVWLPTSGEKSVNGLRQYARHVDEVEFAIQTITRGIRAWQRTRNPVFLADTVSMAQKYGVELPEDVRRAAGV